jgi:hypothetical protein
LPHSFTSLTAYIWFAWRLILIGAERNWVPWYWLMWVKWWMAGEDRSFWTNIPLSTTDWTWTSAVRKVKGKGKVVPVLD